MSQMSKNIFSGKEIYKRADIQENEFTRNVELQERKSYDLK